MAFKVGIVVASDKCSEDKSRDKTTPAIVDYLTKFNELTTTDKKYAVEKRVIVCDDIEDIKNVIVEWTNITVAKEKLDLILTSGGTGFTDRDCTPEAVKSVLHREASGIVHRMLSESFKITPFAMMARPVAGTRNQTLIITLPGSPKGAVENLEAVIPTLAHALSQIGTKDSRALHQKMERTLENAPPGYGDAPEEISIPKNLPKFEGSPDHAHHHHHQQHDHGHFHSAKDDRAGCGISKHNLVSNDLTQPVTARARSSPYPMTSMTDAYKKILSETSEPVICSIDIREIDPVGYVFAEDVYSPVNVPDFRASIVDGYAVISSDGPGTYPVVSISHASPTEFQHKLSSGEISRVTTGAPLPLGADAVIMVEETKLIAKTEDGSEEKDVEILAADVRPNDNVREIGSDVKKGELVFSKGTVISASGGEVGVLSSIGFLVIKVFKKPVLGVLSTGDELVDTFQNKLLLQYGQIFDSNRPTLLSAAKNSNYEVVDLKIASDDKRSLEDIIRHSFTKYKIDYLITTGGVSMGELDLLKPIIERVLGGTIHFGRVKMKPGKPTTFATFEHDQQKKFIFALPGNPASAAVCFYLFVLPSLRLFSGYAASNGNTILPSLPTVKARLEADTKLDPRPEYQRVHTYQDNDLSLIAKNTGFQRSSRIASFRNANGLIALPSRDEFGASVIKAGELVDVLLFGPVGSSV